MRTADPPNSLCNSAKIALYAKLDGAIAEHRTILSAREEMLGGARENLLREGGAIGNASGSKDVDV